MHRIADALAQIQRSSGPPKHESIWGFVVGTVVLGLFFWLLESIWPEDRVQPRWRASSKVDLFYWFLGYFVASRIAAVVVLTAIVVLIILRVPHGVTAVTRQPVWLQAIEAPLLGDFCGYWAHRILHSVPRLWRIHALHHSSTQLDWLASARVHPLESVWTKMFIVTPFFLAGFSPGIAAFYGPFFAFYPIFIHCNLRWGYGKLGYVIASPAFHRWHHAADEAALNRNFSGLFPFWDFLFGTAYFPKDRKPEAYGLAGEVMPTRIPAQLAYPFR